MLKLLSVLATYFKPQGIVIENPIFRIHTSFTTVLLFILSLVITWNQCVKEPIRCFAFGVRQIRPDWVNTYCWLYPTFLLPEKFRKSSSQDCPGFGNNYDDDETVIKYDSYYQWVWFFIILQALLFYFPKWLRENWDHWDNGLLTAILWRLNTRLRVDVEKNRKQWIVINCLVRHWDEHNGYTFLYWFCELLCLLNIIFQMLVINWCFKGDFLLYGFKLLTFDNEDQEDRFNLVFPRVTKCIFPMFGPFGYLENHDATCLLPLNIVNEKTYIFLWFWFVVLAVLTAALVIFRILLICSPRLRSFMLCTRNRMVPKEAADSISRRVSVGDWWVIYMLGGNMDPQLYKEVIEELAKKSSQLHISQYLLLQQY